MFGFKSKNSVYKLINKLVDLGVIDKDDQGKIVPISTKVGLPLLGTVQAGFPTLAEQDFSKTIDVDDYLIGKGRGAHYILTVNGDSMIEAGIHEGDLVIVEKTENAKLGDIVVACVDGDWTMKYLRRDKRNRFYLEPANAEFSNIYPEAEMTIGGVVRSVIRKY